MIARTALKNAITQTPRIEDDDAAAQFREDASALIAKLDPDTSEFLAATASCSPYLRRLMLRDLSYVKDVLETPPEELCARIEKETAAIVKTGAYEAHRRRFAPCKRQSRAFDRAL